MTYYCSSNLSHISFVATRKDSHNIKTVLLYILKKLWTKVSQASYLTFTHKNCNLDTLNMFLYIIGYSTHTFCQHFETTNLDVELDSTRQLCTVN